MLRQLIKKKAADNQKQYIAPRFIRQEKGGLAIIFAILLPFIFSCCALVFDGSRLLAKRARMADALNEAALAIATASSANPNTEEQAKLKTLLNNYVNAYLPGETINSSNVAISFTKDPETDTPLPIFDISASIKIKTMLPFDMVPAFSPTINLGNKGKVRKGLQDLGRPADYVFVVDFSGSMNSASAQSGMSRIALLKKVVKDITSAAIDAYPETTFAIVPFEVGVPVKYKIQESDTMLIYPDKNELGGDVPGCSVLMVPKAATHATLNMKIGYDIDYAFWSNKSYYLKNLPIPSVTATSLPYSINDVNRILNYGRYSYFKNYVLPSLTRVLGRTATWQDLIDRGWCTRNSSVPENHATEAPYTCEKPPVNPLLDKDLSIFSTQSDSKNQKIIEAEMEAARRIFTAYGGMGNSMFAIEAIDIEATLNGMFDESNIISFPVNYASWHDSVSYYQRPFPHMCLSSGHDDSTMYNGTRNQLAEVKQNAYLIEPTSDLTILEKFQSMKSDGGTDSSSGLLRAVPELIKGPNPRKVLIVISDGDDNSYSIRDALHKNRTAGNRVCDRIRDGVRQKSAVTEEVDIYFISVVDGVADRERTKYWADYYTGAENAVVATNYDDIMSKLVEIMNKFEETGYFYN